MHASCLKKTYIKTGAKIRTMKCVANNGIVKISLIIRTQFLPDGLPIVNYFIYFRPGSFLISFIIATRSIFAQSPMSCLTISKLIQPF